MKSTTAKYGTVAVAIHWLSAILIFAMLGSGFRAASTVDAEAKASILTVHATFGVMILVLTLARAAWWMFADRKPDQPAGEPRWQAASAKAVHALFYVVILGMAASGIGMMVLSGAAALSHQPCKSPQLPGPRSLEAFEALRPKGSLKTLLACV